MRRLFAVVVVLLAVAAWVTGSPCPVTWAAMTPTQTRPAQPDTYRVTRPNGGPAIVWSLAAVRSAFTVNGVFQNVALDDALALATVVSLDPGRAAQVRCTWRPLGGSP